MMELKGAFVELGGKVWLRRGLRLFIRCGSISNQKINNNHNAAAAEESGMLLQKGGGVVSCSWADQEEGERGGGVVRMKIVVRKSDLKHLVSTASTGVKAAATPQQRPTTRTTTISCVNVKVPYPYSTAEQRLNNLLWRKQNNVSVPSSKPLLKAARNNCTHHKCWSPALQTIPE